MNAMPTLLVALGFLLAALAGLVALLRLSLPTLSGEERVDGLAAPVDIVRDAHGVPHVFASRAQDAWFGLGYVHAQDRLWQMEYQRRLVAGRLAEIFGKSAVPADVAVRTLGLGRAAERSLEHLPEFARQAVESYVDGVNQALRAQTGRRRPLEFQALRIEVEPWTAVDVLACGKLLAWNLAGTYVGDLLRSDMLAKLGAERASELMAFGDDGAGARVDLPGVAPGAPVGPLDVPAEAHAGGEGRGSNQWAVDGTRTTTGKPMLANDPHLPPSLPGAWYLAHVSAPDLDVIGATVPGIPAVLAGRNRRIGWGIASLEVDVQDLFREPVGPDGALAAQAQVASRQERIQVRGGEPVIAQVSSTAHGPIVSGFVGPKANGAPPPPLALSWTGLDEQDATLAAFLRVNQARDWAEFSEALRPYVAPMLLFTYADVDGNVGSRMAGRVPRRSGGDGSRVVDVAAAGGAGDWDGSVPFDEMPACFNPAGGVVLSANTSEVPPGYPHFLGREHIVPYRRARIEALLDRPAPLSLEAHAALQLDTHSPQAATLLPLLLPHVTPADGVQARALDLLRAWDRDMRADSPAASVFAAWWRELPRALAAAELGPELFKGWELWPSYTDRYVRGRLAEGTGQARTRAAVQRSFADAVAGLAARLGRNPARWRWGRLHRAVFAHRPFHRLRLVRPLVSRSLAIGGDWSSVNVGGTWAYDKPFEAKHVAGYRQVLDLSTPDRGLFIQAVGQSGHVLSRHYADLARRWQQGRYLPMRLSKDEVVKAKHALLRLHPSGPQA